MATMKEIKNLLDDVNEVLGVETGKKGSIDILAWMTGGYVAVVCDDCHSIQELIATGPKKKNLLVGINRVYDHVLKLKKQNKEVNALNFSQADFS